MSLAAADLDALDALMTRAFATGDASRLDVLGYGEMTTVVAFASGGKRYACKRLPPFATAQDADRYAALFLDVTTPMLKDEAGRDRLDTELFLAAVPPPVRPLFRRYVVHQVIDKYHDPRGVALDLIANLIKEGQEHRIAPFLQAANRRLAQPLDQTEVRRYYEGDARVWTAWQAMRRVDRFVRTRLLRKPYPFLLPGRIERRGARERV